MSDSPSSWMNLQDYLTANADESQRMTQKLTGGTEDAYGAYLQSLGGGMESSTGGGLMDYGRYREQETKRRDAERKFAALGTMDSRQAALGPGAGALDGALTAGASTYAADRAKAINNNWVAAQKERQRFDAQQREGQARQSKLYNENYSDEAVAKRAADEKAKWEEKRYQEAKARFRDAGYRDHDGQLRRDYGAAMTHRLNDEWRSDNGLDRGANGDGSSTNYTSGSRRPPPPSGGYGLRSRVNRPRSVWDFFGR